MKILYAIQGTGNGHLARAEDIVPALKKYGAVDLFVSGAQADLELPFEVKYKSKGLSFYFGKNGGVDLLKTVRKNKSKDVFTEIRHFPVREYDVVINDFEPISAWAARLKKVPCISLSHQSALLSESVPKPKHFDPVGSWILQNYAPADAHVGFHFSNFDNNIFTPVIRNAVRICPRENNGHYTVYLPAYDEQKILPLLLSFPSVRWEVFSKHSRSKYRVGKVSVCPVNNEAFSKSLASAEGVLCGAGFETPAESLFLGKKLMVVPMKKQFEQFYNAEALKLLGVPVLKNLKKKRKPLIEEWLDSNQRVTIDYKDTTAAAVGAAIDQYKELITC